MTDTTVPPQDGDAEAAVLGACLIAPAAIDTAAEILRPEDFYNLSHGRLFTEILAMHNAGGNVDAITLTDRLPLDKTLVYDLARSVPDSVRAGSYARIVKEAADHRNLIRAGSEIAALGWERTQNGQEAAERILYAVGDRQATGEDVDVPAAVRRAYDLIVSGRRDMLGADTGIVDLDRITRGFRRGDLVIVAGDTGRGKTALALGAAMHLLRQDKPVAFYSLEMTDDELLQRAISLESGISHGALERGDLTPQEHARLVDACAALVAVPLKMRTEGTVSPAGIRADLRRWKAKNPDAALVIVDYLQLLTPDDKTDNRTVDVSAISRSLKITAMDIGVPVLALSQFHRRVNLDERPHRSNLRESGSIENDASVVVLVHRPSKWDTDPQKRGTAELIVAKNRHGKEDVITVKWTPEEMRFGNWVHDAREAFA